MIWSPQWKSGPDMSPIKVNWTAQALGLNLFLNRIHTTDCQAESYNRKWRKEKKTLWGWGREQHSHTTMAPQLVGRFVREWPMLHYQYYCTCAAFRHLLLSSSPSTPTPIRRRFPSATVYSARRSVHNRSRGLRLPNAPTPSDRRDDGGGATFSDSGEQKSRNQLKREARRAVRWGMDLASFTPTQIKHILRSPTHFFIS